MQGFRGLAVGYVTALRTTKPNRELCNVLWKPHVCEHDMDWDTHFPAGRHKLGVAYEKHGTAPQR
jgi:hypothetical protein